MKKVYAIASVFIVCIVWFIMATNNNIVKKDLTTEINETWGQKINATIFLSTDLEDDEALKDRIVKEYAKYGELSRDRINILDTGFKKSITIDGATFPVIVFYNEIGFHEDSIRFNCKRVIRDAIELNESVDDRLRDELNDYIAIALNLGYIYDATYDKETNVVTLDYKDKLWTIDLNRGTEKQ